MACEHVGPIPRGRGHHREAFVCEGEEDFVGELLTALFAKGHVLLESRPGLGKTTLVRSLGTALGLPFGSYFVH